MLQYRVLYSTTNVRDVKYKLENLAIIKFKFYTKKLFKDRLNIFSETSFRCSKKDASYIYF